MSKPRCINVESRFAGYRLGYDDPAFRGTSDPWLKRILCRSGFVAAHGGTELVACTSGKRSKAAQVMRTDMRFRVTQDGDDGINAVFDVKDWRFVFELMGARRK